MYKQLFIEGHKGKALTKDNFPALVGRFIDAEAPFSGINEAERLCRETSDGT